MEVNKKMSKGDVKRPAYDGNACMLYDFMISQDLTEEVTMQRMGMDKEREVILGEEISSRAPWNPVATWIEHPSSIPRHYILGICKALNASVEAVFTKSRILNNKPFELYGGSETQVLENIPSDKLVTELKRRGYRIYKEV